ncbi:MAG: hypothetical protein KGL39_36050 [Patescibacteria group bacterium]|nr:hypothetical protein [Patescibacteria group bacterium]
MADEIKATPRNKYLGLLADALQSAGDFVRQPFGYDNPPVKMALGLLNYDSLPKTVNELSYGGALGTGSGMTWKPKADTVDAAMLALPAVKSGGLLAGKGAVATGKFVAPKAAEMTENYMARTGMIQPLTVWHGSPHTFTKFDSSKIGTGEGAQAYGYGIYFAESPEVAQRYQEALQHKGYSSLIQNGPNDYSVIAPDGTEVSRGYLGKASREKAAFDASQKGSLYKIDLPDEHIARMLDWDKPLSQQHPDVKDAVRNFADLNGMEHYTPAGESAPVVLRQGISQDTKGSDVYRWFGRNSTSSEAADTLRFMGIPGIRYLDGGSRGAGAGTSNFVLFPGNENMATILERNGQPLTGLLGQ